MNNSIINAIINCDCLEFLKSKEFQELKESRECVIVTDPPFNIGYHYATYKDKMKENEYLDFLKEILDNAQLPYVLVHYPEALYKIALKMSEAPEKVVSWVYNSNTPRQHRDIAYFKIKPDFKQMTQPYKNPNDKRIKERIAKGCKGGKLYDWWNENQVKNISKEKTEHPCQMPLQVMKNAVGILPQQARVGYILRKWHNACRLQTPRIRLYRDRHRQEILRNSESKIGEHTQ